MRSFRILLFSLFLVFPAVAQGQGNDQDWESFKNDVDEIEKVAIEDHLNIWPKSRMISFLRS